MIKIKTNACLIQCTMDSRSKGVVMISNIVSRYCGRLVFICDMYQTASFDNKVQTF